MQQKYGQKVVFLTVYITEAHAKNEWPCGKTLSFCDQPKTTEERCEIACIAKKKYSLSLPILVDTINNSFDAQFAAWPFRFYGLTFNKGSATLGFKAQPDLQPWYAYEVTIIETWLKENI